MRSWTCSGKGILNLTHNSGHYALRQIFVYNIIPLLKEIYYGRDEILYEKVLSKKFFSKKGSGENSYYVREDEILNNIESFKTEIQSLVGNTNGDAGGGSTDNLLNPSGTRRKSNHGYT